MELSKSLLNQEVTVLDNVINKLQVYMDQNKQTLYGLASTMGFAYQPFYRLITKKHLPTLNSLTIIAAHFDCSVSELIHEDIFIDINCFDSFDDAALMKETSKIRVYIPYKQFLPLTHNSFFAVKAPASEQTSKQNKGEVQLIANGCSVFYRLDYINIDGIFLINYKSKNMLIEVLSVSSKYIVALLNGKETKIDVHSIRPIARFFSGLALINKNQPIIVGVTKWI